MKDKITHFVIFDGTKNCPLGRYLSIDEDEAPLRQAPQPVPELREAPRVRPEPRPVYSWRVRSRGFRSWRERAQTFEKQARHPEQSR